MSKTKGLPACAGSPIQTIAQMLKGFRQHNPEKAFADFLEMTAIAISNTTELARRDEREVRYLQIVDQYSKDEVRDFARMFGELVYHLDEEGCCNPFADLWTALDLRTAWKGQFFTPYTVASVMAQVLLGDLTEEEVARRGFFEMNEPCSGPGGMIAATAEAFQRAGFSYQRQMHVTAQDIDLRCVHMTYILLSLLHIPAVVQHMNTLSLECWDAWYTPAHIWGGWTRRASRDREDKIPPPWHSFAEPQFTVEVPSVAD
jgi:hypothetical protein